VDFRILDFEQLAGRWITIIPWESWNLESCTPP
jgi:hypothetical protein